MKEIIKTIIDKMAVDNKGRIKLIITAILIIIFILSWTNTIKVIQERRGGGKKPSLSSQTQVTIESSKIKEVPFVQGIDEEDGLEWIRCPFCGMLYIDGEGGIIALSGILWDDKAPKAVINGEIVGIGDKINKYSVVDIDRNTVTLNDGTKDIKVSLGE